MTGTAKTEEKEFVEIYGLNVVEIPTNRVLRADKNDLIFQTKEAEFAAVVQDLKERHGRGSRSWSARSTSRRPSTCRS